MTMTAAGGWARGARDVVEFLWPRRCPACAGPAGAGALLCESCAGRIPRMATPVCVRCLVNGADDPRCPNHPGFTVWPAWSYDERAALVVEALKFGQRPDLADGLADELARVSPRGFAPDLVTGVPLHPTRERERGYNPSRLLADALSGRLGVPHLPAMLMRVRATRPQSRLGPAARRANLRAAFRAPRPATLRGRRVLLVDDVVTTGATLESALDALRRAGAEAQAVTLAWAQ